MAKSDLQSLFLSYVKPLEGDDACWEWQGFITKYGYGRIGAVKFGTGKAYESAHRLSYKLFCEDIPDDIYVLHKCDNRRCVRPSHLFLGTKGDNNSDRKAKGRNAVRIGSKNTMALLDEETVAIIRASKLSGRTIAKQLRISETSVTQVRNGTTWGHVDATNVKSGQSFRVFFDGLEPRTEAHELARLYQGGQTLKQLSVHFETTEQTLRNALELMGVKRRRAGVATTPVVVNGRSYPTVTAAMKAEKLGYAAIKAMQEKMRDTND